jgi:hypothetical protein
MWTKDGHKRGRNFISSGQKKGSLRKSKLDWINKSFVGFLVVVVCGQWDTKRSRTLPRGTTVRIDNQPRGPPGLPA